MVGGKFKGRFLRDLGEIFPPSAPLCSASEEKNINMSSVKMCTKCPFKFNSWMFEIGGFKEVSMPQELLIWSPAPI